MVEILVTLTIVAFGLLGLLGLQARALTFQKDSFNRKSAAEMVAQLAERMRANHLGFVSGNYDFNFSAATADPAVINECATITACTWVEVATRDLNQWTAELRRRMPLSAAYINFNPAVDARMVEVALAWPEPQQAGALASGNDLICDDLNVRFGAALTPIYRCYRTFIFP
ncbi:MAG: type IV pilus modification protein PilV [Burkholderiaceae bacterium]|nr:type IV pilus modification protein PilV [Burkholderiaceae bacterium]